MVKQKKSLHSILGLASPSRVKKPTQPPRSSPSKRKPLAPRSRQPGGSEGEGRGEEDEGDEEEEDDADYFQDHLDDHGLVRTLVTDLHFSDAVQAMRFIRARMWTPMPDRRTGMKSGRVSEVLNYRLTMPPVVTTAHLRAILTASPSTVEREVAELIDKGIVRRVVVRGRSEALVEVGDLVEMVEKSDADEGSKAAYARFVRGELAPQGLEMGQVDALVKAGFLTTSPTSASGLASNGGSRPTGLLGTRRTLAHLATAPTGSLDVVGGGAIQMVTGSGTTRSTPASSSLSSSSSPSSQPPSSEIVSISVPNNGAFIKLLKASLDHLVSLLERRSAYRQMPESALREAWDGGLATSGGKRARGEFAGVLPGRTRKWKDYWGLRFEWVLEEAVGAGLVEVFETGSVGRGVRAL
ncbi:uncharacterized protein DNG_00570 [Cephalotrichum gorgonifer]|uniref:Serine-threonine protein kinase 19-domain-containing protein n=1 Tax=Cephalotrichum gorgonifer TaxID=2041049 RepID=A0AAE8MQ69_9PEZI|nr:uncharacterized protein DNG_00570 [Cephalotrichum gorgonifer]